MWPGGPVRYVKYCRVVPVRQESIPVLLKRFTNFGSAFLSHTSVGDPSHFGADPDPTPFVSDFKNATKTFFFIFSFL
jgi:hypothetical protein